jgi:hypothetical protein
MTFHLKHFIIHMVHTTRLVATAVKSTTRTATRIQALGIVLVVIRRGIVADVL